MKSFIQLFASIAISLAVIVLLSSSRQKVLDAKEIIGAWEYGPAENHTVMINTGNVFSVATYDLPGKKFLHSYGGSWRIDGYSLIKKIEWNSQDSSQVGEEVTEEVQLSGGKMFVKKSNKTWSRVDNGKPGELFGAWIITGNFSDDTVSKRSSPFFPRRTMKVLSGKHFQWIAYNVQTKAFMNAGGGTYTTINGKYTENIEFFTKTPESVGKKIEFNFSFVNGDWRHKGQKSTGGAMDECWTKREMLEK